MVTDAHTLAGSRETDKKRLKLLGRTVLSHALSMLRKDTSQDKRKKKGEGAWRS